MSTLGSGSEFGATPQAATGPPVGTETQTVGALGKSLVRRFFEAFQVSSWKRVPFPLILLAFWNLLRWTGVGLSIGSVVGIVLMALSFLVIMLEFWKSGDIALPSFIRDQTFAVIATLCVGVTVTLVWEHRVFYIADLFVIAAVLTDALISSVNSYRTALRNIQAGISQGSGHDAAN